MESQKKMILKRTKFLEQPNTIELWVHKFPNVNGFIFHLSKEWIIKHSLTKFAAITSYYSLAEQLVVHSLLSFIRNMTRRLSCYKISFSGDFLEFLERPLTVNEQIWKRKYMTQKINMWHNKNKLISFKQ